MALPADYLIVQNETHFRLYRVIEGEEYRWNVNDYRFSYDIEVVETFTHDEISMATVVSDWNLCLVVRFPNNEMYRIDNRESNV